MRYLLDTNAVIALLRQSSAILVERVKTSPTGDLGVPAVVMHELFFGAFKSQQTERNLRAFRALQRDFPVVDFDLEDAHTAGEIRATLARLGTPIGPYDMLIAAQAKQRGLTLVTNNLREFQRVEGLAIEDWMTA